MTTTHPRFNASSNPIAASPATPRRWATRYAHRLLVTDLLLLAVVSLVSHLVWLGDHIATVPVHTATVLSLSTTETSLLVFIIWAAALATVDSRDEGDIGTGTTEYRRVMGASLITFGIVLVCSFFLGLDLSRGWVLTEFGVGLAALVGGRWGWRQWLVAQRRRGGYSHRVVLIGTRATVAATARDLAYQPGHGYRVVAASITDRPTDALDTDESGALLDLPLVRDIESVPGAMAMLHADTVIATSTDNLSPQVIRDLAWHLDPTHQLVVTPSLTDVGGSRIHLRPAAGLPLIHVETPHYAGAGRFAKRAFDLAAAAGALVVMAPLFAAVALLIRHDGPGGVFYSQERVGRNGELFRILKFRSMHPDADARLAELTTGTDKGLFKMIDDPRVTRIGKVLRRYSLDELPQLVNVLRGDMSLVGPRPALPQEVSAYDLRELRRLAVTPGLSGLWQVSGRSDLSWSDGIRLDLYYVENWSMTQDLVILWRTAKAVLSPTGAY